MKNTKKLLLKESTLLVDLAFIFFILCGVSTIFVIYTPKEVLVRIIEWNRDLEWSQNWWGLYTVYLIEAFLISFFWDLILYRFFFVTNFFYRELTNRLIKKRWLIVKLIRIKYGFDKIYYYLRPGMIKSSSTSDKELIDEITAPKVYEWIKFLFFVVISFHSLLAGILTFLTYEGSPIGKVISYSKDKWGEGLHFLLDNLTKLSAVVVFVLLIFLWYFVSKYGVTRRAIAQANKKKLEDVIQLFRKLDEPISKVILKGSENIQYAFNCYDLIQEFWVFNKYPNVFIKSHRNYLITEWEREGSNYFLFNDIAEIDDVIKGLEILNSPENKKFTYWFSRYRFELVRFINMTSIRVDKLGTYDRLLFTKKGFSSITEKKTFKICC
ncbi:hypothetical protein [Paenibacillus yonginensis]|nr:hypothetical protein [Paenibacillus yonginensis]